MRSVIPPGDPNRTVIAGKDQGYLGLAINYGTLPDGTPTMTRAYEPTPDELERLNNGASIIFQQLGTPPIRPEAVYVGEVPDV